MSKVPIILKVQMNAANEARHEMWYRALLAIECLYKCFPVEEWKFIDKQIEESLNAGPFLKWKDYPFKNEEAPAEDLL